MGELGDTPCLNLRKESVSPARHPRHLLCCVSSRGCVGMVSREDIYNYTDPVGTQYQNTSVTELCGVLWARLHIPKIFMEIVKGGRLLRVY